MGKLIERRFFYALSLICVVFPRGYYRGFTLTLTFRIINLHILDIHDP